VAAPQPTEPPEPTLDHPVSPDEQRGFPRPARVARRTGKGGAVKIELAVIIVVFGPIILIRFLRSLSARARRARGKAPPRSLQPKQGLKRKLAPSQWANPERIGGEHWRN